MEYLDEIHEEFTKISNDLDPTTIETIRSYERVMFFERLRELIREKDIQNDEIASAILGWAYEKLAD